MPDFQPLRAIAALLIALLPAVLPASAQSDREIAPQSTLEVTLGRWDPVTETYTAWPDLGGDYTVGADGTLVLPMAGEIETDGLRPAELGQEIARRLGTRMGLAGQVSASVSIVAHEPVYVLGGVQAAGAYPYRSRMTVLQALSLAGGVTSPEAAFLRSERNALSTMGEYRVLELNLLRSLAARARLEAELADAPRIDTPEAIAEAPLGDELMAQERAIREARDAAHESSLRQFEELEELLRERIARIDTQLELRDRQLALAREELQNTTELVERGLSVESRRSALEQRVSDREVARLELETAQLNAAQQLNELARDRSELINERRKSLVERIGDVRLEIEKLRVRMDTQAALYAEALRYGDGFVAMDRAGGATFEITRRDGDGVTLIEAEESTRLRPGDVLRVALSGPGAAVAESGASAAAVDPGLPDDLASSD